jgi:pimeloyl-ACP methyl ester carboxylesterase
VLAGELAAAAAGAWMAAWAMSLSLAFTILLIPLVFLTLQLLIVATSQVLGRVSAQDASVRLSTALALRICLTEGPTFALAKLAMSVEPWLSFPDRAQAMESSPARPVLLIHGVLCNRAVWGPVCRRLQAAGFGPIHAINLEPLDADIDVFVEQVKREVSALCREAPDGRVAVVAHSMGGLVARAAMQRGASESISHLVTLGTPHHGSVLARLVPGVAGRQMQPASSWLQALNAAANRSSAHVVSIYSEHDNLVSPARSAVLQGAGSRALRGLGHFGLLRSPQAFEHVLAALLPKNVAASREP